MYRNWENLMGINPDALLSNLQTDLEDLAAYKLLDWQVAAASALKSSFYKKFVDMEAPDAEAKALAKFSAINDRCRTFSWGSLTDSDLSFLSLLRETLQRWYDESDLGSLTFGSILDKGRTGPGASLKARGNDFYTKLFDSPLSCTKEYLYTVYRQYVTSCPRWESAEDFRQSNHGKYVMVEGNTLSFVPKTNAIKRTICTEPTINMVFQLGLGSWIEDCLREKTGIDLGIQPDKNRELARIGSVEQSFGTIDLESASDSLSIKMIKDVLPRGLYSWLNTFRSPVSRVYGKPVELHMVSTMGNGFTFPLQTLLFAAVVVATMREARIKIRFPRRNCLGNFGVFGDDIIVPTMVYDKVVYNLNLLGFKVNISKSFNEGPFRESCGYDYFSGHNIRGVYVKSLSSVQDRFVVLNRLLDWTARTGLPVRNVCQALLRTVPDNPVPLAENDDSGLKTPLYYLRNRVRDKHTQSILYKRWVAREVAYTVDGDKCEVYVPRGQKRRLFNYDGLLMAFLYGGITAAPVKGTKVVNEYRCSVRHDTTRYSQRKAVSPNWDSLPTGLGMVSCQVGLRALEESFLLNCVVE
jgi:hypothetical protein